MNRLTSPRVNGIKTGYWSPAKKEDVVQRLGKYEDTGLTPEEIQEVRKAPVAIVPEWIRPAAEMPRFHERVLIARIYEPGQPLKVEQATLLPDGWWKVFGTHVRKVEFWMPMPKAPEG